MLRSQPDLLMSQDLNVVVPPEHDERMGHDVDSSHLKHPISLEQYFEIVEAMYRTLRQHGWGVGEARQVLPIAIKAQIVHKANMTEWRHIFKMRCDKYAHWEIRRVMINLLHWCQGKIPIIFDDFHFFDAGRITYARPIMSRDRMRDTLLHYLESIHADVKWREDIIKQI